VCGSTTNYHVNPERFALWKSVNGPPHCRPESEMANGDWSINLKDQNSDTTWSYSFEGTQLDTMNVNFDRGTLQTNSERSSTSDKARAHFNNLQFQVAGTSTWYTFTDLRQSADDMGDGWNCIEVAVDNQKVEQNTRSCALQ